MSKVSAVLLSPVLIVLLLVPLVGCNRESVFKLYGYDRDSLLYKFTPLEDKAFAQHYVDLLRRDRFDEIEDQLDSSVKTAEIRDTLTRMHGLFPRSEPASIRTVSTAFVRRRNGDSTSSITLEYEFAPQVTQTTESIGVTPRIWLLAQVVIRMSEGAKTIRGITVFPIPKSYEEMNEFTLRGRGISQYAGLSLAVGVAAFTLYAVVLCIRSKIGRKKWIWLIPVLVGLLRFTLNWTSGQWTLTPLAINVPPVVARAEPYGPWSIDIYAPVGAIAFLVFRKKRMEAIATSSPAEPPTLEQLTGTAPHA